MAFSEGSLCPVSQVWILNESRTTNLGIADENGIAHKIQIQAAQKLRQESSLDVAQQRTKANSMRDIIVVAQDPQKEALESMLMELSTSLPLLLQDASQNTSQKSQCERLCQRIREHFRAWKGGSN